MHESNLKALLDLTYSSTAPLPSKETSRAQRLANQHSFKNIRISNDKQMITLP